MKKTVVLLHGFGEDSSVWSGFVPFLQKDFYILTPDYARLSNFKSVEEYADFVHEKIVEKCIEKCVMIGHSMGGYIALAFAEKYPEMLNGLGLFHSTSFADSEEKKAARTKNIDFIDKHGAEAFIKTSTPNLYAEAFQKNHPEVIEKHIKYVSTPIAEAITTSHKA